MPCTRYHIVYSVSLASSSVQHACDIHPVDFATLSVACNYYPVDFATSQFCSRGNVALTVLHIAEKTFESASLNKSLRYIPRVVLNYSGCRKIFLWNVSQLVPDLSEDKYRHRLARDFRKPFEFEHINHGVPLRRL